MPWSTPPNPVANVDTISASHIVALSNDVSYLATRPVYHAAYQGTTSDYSITATTWTDVDATNMIAPITVGIANSKVLIRFIFLVSSITGGSTTMYFDVTDGTARSTGANNGVVITSIIGLITVEAWFSGVAAGAKTYKLQSQVSSGTTAVIKKNGFPIIIHAEEK